MFTLDFLELVEEIPQEIIDFMRSHGHFPKYFERYTTNVIQANGTTTVFLIALGWLYYFTYSDEDKIVWDVFHPDEVKKLSQFLDIYN